MEYKTIRSKRKTIALVIDDKASLIVRAPLRATDSYISELVLKKSNWIFKKQNEILKKGKVKEKEFVDGEEFWYLGNKYILKIGEYKNIELDKYLLFPKKYLPKAKIAMIAWYRIETLGVLKERLDLYSKITGWKFESLTLSNAKRQWGVCDNRHRIKLNWRLIMAPLDIIDYVVIHELAHTIQPNHSKKFWIEVEKIMPNYILKRKWLKENSKYLNI